MDVELIPVSKATKISKEYYVLAYKWQILAKVQRVDPLAHPKAQLTLRRPGY